MGAAVASAADAPESAVPPQLRESFAELSERTAGLEPRVLALGLRAFANARARDQVSRNRLTIIDFSLPSVEQRMWVVDLDTDEVLFHELVAHGKSTGGNHARSFSNEPGSHASSLGTFITGGTYEGKHGFSLKLTGLEPGFNDRALERAIVVHAAWYVSPDFAKRHGRLGRSWGCPAVRPEVAEELIDAIRGGSVMFAYYPDPDFEQSSTYLR